jgi:hypothetical protein
VLSVGRWYKWIDLCEKEMHLELLVTEISKGGSTYLLRALFGTLGCSRCVRHLNCLEIGWSSRMPL